MGGKMRTAWRCEPKSSRVALPLSLDRTGGCKRVAGDIPLLVFPTHRGLCCPRGRRQAAAGIVGIAQVDVRIRVRV